MSAPGLSLIWVRKRTVAKARSWPGPGLPVERHKLTLVDRPTAPKVGFPAPSRTHTAGQERTLNVRAERPAVDSPLSSEGLGVGAAN